jgi:hypothetical protein
MRIYDSRLGKFLSVDPLAKSYPFYTPYSFAGNKPIRFIDLDGAEEWDNSGTVTPYIKPIPYNGDAGDVMNFITNNTVIALYNGASSLANAGPAAVDYLRKPGNTYTGAVNEGLSAVENNNRSTQKYFNKTPLKQIAKDGLNSFTHLQNYDLAAQILFTGSLSKLKITSSTPTFPLPIEYARYNLANKFYASFGESNIESKLAGIDFSQPLQTTTLKAGTVVEQWVGADGTIGKYFAPVGSDVSTLGINTEGRSLKQFTLTNDVKVLKSTAADFKDPATGQTYKGGGTQYFNPELKKAAAPYSN